MFQGDRVTHKTTVTEEYSRAASGGEANLNNLFKNINIPWKLTLKET